MKDYVYKLSTEDKIASALHVFSTELDGRKYNINWYYGSAYENNIPASPEDPREYHHQFENWVNDYKDFIREGSTVIDIGAFTGDTVLSLAFMAGKGGKAIAFEPHPKNFKELDRNVAANPFLDIDIYNAAVMEEDGEFDFLYQTDCNGCKNGGPSGKGSWTVVTHDYNEPVRVKGININKLLHEKYDIDSVSFIKSDTEGHDLKILRSIIDIIANVKPAILIERIPGQEHEIKALIEEIGYVVVDKKTKFEVYSWKWQEHQDLLLLPENSPNINRRLG